MYVSVPVPAGTQTILRCVVGSTVHGTSVDGQDDRDEMAIAIPPPEYVLGLKHWETSAERTKPEGVRSGPGDLDLVTHSLKKWCALAARGNPTILLPLFVPPYHRSDMEYHPIGGRLIANRDLFITKDAGRAFLGYLTSQRAKLEGARGGKHGTRPELVEKYGFDTKYAGHVIRLACQGTELMEYGKLTLPMPAMESGFVVDIRTGRYTLDQVLKFADDMTVLLQLAVIKSVAPEHADTDKITAFLVESYKEAWDFQKGPIG